MTGAKVDVYDRTGVTLLATLTHVRALRWQDSLNRTGVCSFEVKSNDPALLANPALLAHHNIVKIRADLDDGAGLVERAGFRIRNRITPVVSPAEAAGKWRTVSGRGLLVLCAGAGVLPENGLDVPALKPERWFSGASKDYDHSAWLEPIIGGGVLPADWPETVDAAAQTIWPVAQAADENTEYKEAWFWGEFVVPGSGPINVTVAATADDFFELWVNGDKHIAQTSQVFQWKNIFPYEMQLVGGTTCRVAAKVWDAFHTSWFLCSIVERDSAGEVLQVLFRTSTAVGSGWKARLVEPAANPAATPVGMTHGQVVLLILAENAALAGTSPIEFLTPTFTATHDSAGVPWTILVDRSFPIGTDLLDVLEQLCEDGCDVAVTPDMQLHMWVDRGTDRTATVKFLPASVVPTAQANLLEHVADSTAPDKTLLHVQNSAEQITEQADIDELTLVGYLALGSTSSRSQTFRLAAQALELLSTAYVTLTSAVRLIAGARPYVDFDLGDEVTTLDEAGVQAPATCISHGFVQDSRTGRLTYTPEWLL